MGPPPLPGNVYAGTSAAVPAQQTQPYGHGAVGTSQGAFAGTAPEYQRNHGGSPGARVLGDPTGGFPSPGDQQDVVPYHHEHSQGSTQNQAMSPGGLLPVDGSAQQGSMQYVWFRNTDGQMKLYAVFANTTGGHEYRPVTS